MSTTLWRQPLGGVDPRASAGSRAIAWTIVALLSCAAVALLVQRFDAALVLLALVLALGLATLVLSPQLAIIVVVFLLYTNIPTIAAKQGVPVMLASAFLGLLLLPLLQQLIVHRERMRFDRTFLLMIVLLVVLIGSSIGVRNPEAAREHVKIYLLEGMLLYWLVINVVRTLPALRRVLWTLLAAGSLLGALTLYQDLTGNLGMQFGGLAQRNYEYLELASRDDEDAERKDLMARAVGKRGVSGRSTRPGGPVSLPNRFAQIMLVLIPLAVYMRRTATTRAARTAALGAAALIATAIVLTLSRGAFLNFMLLAIAMTFVRWLRMSHVLLATVAVVVGAAIVQPTFFERIVSIGNATHVFSDDVADRSRADGAIRGRTTSMMTAWAVFRDHPFLGVGPGQYVDYALEYTRRLDNPPRDIMVPRRAHNLYLELLADGGVIGLAAFLGIIGWLLLTLWSRRRALLEKHPASADLATACAFSLLVYLGTGVFAHFSFQRYYWFTLALSGVALHVLHQMHGAGSGDRARDEQPALATPGMIR